MDAYPSDPAATPSATNAKTSDALATDAHASDAHASDAQSADAPAGDVPVVEIIEPAAQTLPLVLASPHSGRRYPAAFLAASRLDPLTLRRSEDSYVDEIFRPAAKLGAPMLAAQFPRAYVDPNREAYELDPEMFDGPLPDYVITHSPRIAAGLGTVARIVGQGLEIYDSRLTFAEAHARVDRYYRPYHAALRRLVERTRRRFGFCVVLDCHSMPSRAWLEEMRSSHHPQAGSQFVIGDYHGQTCAPRLVAVAERWLANRGYSTSRNVPYAGGYTTRHYGRPRYGIHALQIEINRALYMDEATLERNAALPELAQQMADLVCELGDAALSYAGSRKPVAADDTP